MALDPKHADWEIAEEAETRMKTAYQLADELGLEKEELLPHGHYVAKVDFNKVLKRLEKKKHDGKFIDVTAITPTPLWVRKIHYNHGTGAGFGKKRQKGCWRHSSTIRRTYYEYQRFCNRWWAFPMYSFNTFFSWVDR